MLCTVCGFSTRPYSFDDKRTGRHLEGITFKVSVFLYDYPTDDKVKLVGVGQRYAEYKFPESLINSFEVGDQLFVELDDDEEKVKSAMLKDQDTGFFMPLS